MTYAKAVGLQTTLLIVVFIIINKLVQLSSDIWLSKWTNDNAIIANETNKDELTHRRLGIYALHGLFQGIRFSRLLVFFSYLLNNCYLGIPSYIFGSMSLARESDTTPSQKLIERTHPESHCVHQYVISKIDCGSNKTQYLQPRDQSRPQ